MARTRAMSGQAAQSAPLVHRLMRWTLRGVVSVHALDAFTQAVLAGGFLNGNYDMLGVHRVNAIAGVVVLGYLQLVITVLYWRPFGGAAWPILASAAISAAESLQIVLCFDRSIAIHVPLGVAIIVATAMLASWAWRGSFGLRRRAHGRAA